MEHAQLLRHSVFFAFVQRTREFVLPTTPMVVTWVGLKSIIMDAGVPSVIMAGAAMMQMSSVGMFTTIILSLIKGSFTQSA